MPQQVRTLGQLQALVEKDEAVAAEFRKDPAAAISLHSAPVPDTPVYRYAVIGLVIIVLAGMGGAILLAAVNRLDSTVLTICSSVATGALGGLVGMLAPQPQGP